MTDSAGDTARSRGEQAPPRHAPAVDQALAVVHASIARMAASETRELLDPPTQPYRLRRLADTDLALFPIVLGTAGFGSGIADDESFRALDAYVAAGGNAIDTTDSAHAGRGEMLVGDWMASRGLRDRLQVMTRVGRHPATPGLSAASLRRAVDASLARLGVERIDLLTLHADDRSTPLEETLTTAGALVEAGKVRHIAAGDYTADRLMESRIIAAQRGLPMFAAAQPRYSLAHREEYEQRVAPVLIAQGLSAMPRQPLASGLLAGIATTRRAVGQLRELDPERADRVHAGGARRRAKVTDALTRVAAERGVHPATIALAWLIMRPTVVAPIASAATAGQVAALIAATQTHLTRAEATALERA